MKLLDLLALHKQAVLARWLQTLYESYPPETAVFLRKEKDRFDNPVGFHIALGLEKLYQALVEGLEVEPVTAALDEIIRVRAVQDFHPSQALAFVFLLKNVIRQELAKEIAQEGLALELLDLDSRIDGIALLAFDVYTRRREKIHDIRVNEIKSRVSAIMRKTGINLDNL